MNKRISAWVRIDKCVLKCIFKCWFDLIDPSGCRSFLQFGESQLRLLRKISLGLLILPGMREKQACHQQDAFLSFFPPFSFVCFIFKITLVLWKTTYSRMSWAEKKNVLLHYLLDLYKAMYFFPKANYIVGLASYKKVMS